MGLSSFSAGALAVGVFVLLVLVASIRQGASASTAVATVVAASIMGTIVVLFFTAMFHRK